MTKFITGQELEKAIYDIIWEAVDTLLIVSPYIKLDDYFRKLFDKHLYNPKLHLLIVFGKNEREVSRSLSNDDFDYFKKFLNVSVVFVPNLHAKYYSNELKGVITSINLYDYSFKHNTEFGVYSESTLINAFKITPNHEAWAMSMHMANNYEVVFVKRPVYEKKMFSAVLGKNYIKSDVLYDVTDRFYGNTDGYKESNSHKSIPLKKLTDFPGELELGAKQAVMPTRDQVENTVSGYCIRTGIKIPFNPMRPFSESAYKKWAEYKNMDYPEAYCHKTGRLSNGKTSMRNPILR
ncbi:MAG: phospholipase D family protein [Saprospiraceae bacterium]